MKITKKTTGLCLSFALGLSMTLTGCGVSNKTLDASPQNTSQETTENSTAKTEYTAKFGHSQVTASPVQDGALYFADLVSKKTNGRVSVEVYPAAQLGGERDLVEGVGMGTVEMGLSVASVCAQFQPGVDAMCLPFLFETKEDVYQILDGEVGQKILSPMENSGVTVLRCFENGFRQLGTNKRIDSISDLQGLKLRAPEGDIYVQTWNALGVNVTATPWNETFTALQTHVVDGEEAPLSIAESAGFGEVIDYFAYINYMYDPLVLYVNSKWLESLPEDLQTAVKEAAIEATDYQRELVTKQEQDAEEKMEKEWNVTFTHPDLEPFQKAVQSVYDTYKYQDNLKLILNALGR